jgi:hypothetical protein
MSQTTITKVGTASAGYVSEVAISGLIYEMPQSAEASSPYPNNRQFATAVCDGDNNLKVIIWESSDGVITRVTDGSGGGASEIAVAGLTSSDLVTAFRSASGDLALIVWSISQISSEASGQQLYRVATASAGGTKGPIAVARLSSTRFVTALPNVDDDLILIVWDYSNRVLTRKGSASAGGVELIELATLTSSRVVTAFPNMTNQLALIVWDIDANGSITRRGSATGEDIKETMAVNSLSDTRIVTSARDADTADLRVDVWDVDANGNVHHIADASAGPIDLVAGGDPQENLFPTAVRDLTGTLQIIAWDVSSAISKAAESPPSDAIVRLAAATLLPGLKPMTFVTALEMTNDNLEVVTWHIQSESSA